MPTLFSELAELARNLESTTSRNKKTELIAQFLENLEDDEIAPAVLLLLGKIFPDLDSRSLELGWRTVKLVLEGRGQTTLNGGPLTIKRVYNTLERIAEAEGTGSRLVKKKLLEGLTTEADKSDVEILTRIVFGEMRIGVSDGLMLEGISEAIGASNRLVRRAHMFTGDIGKVAQIAMQKGVDGLEEIEPKYFIPLKPMLANIIEDPKQAIEEHGGRTAIEYKFDGARIQIHKKEDKIRIYSRRLSDVTESLPDIVDLVSQKLQENGFIVEGEVTAIGSNGNPLPFQDLMRRFTRVDDIDEMVKRIPLRLHLFDILLKGNRLLIDLSYKKRRGILRKTVPSEHLAKSVITADPEVVEGLLNDAMEAGHEGLMAKHPESKYTPGSRGKSWLKIKPTKSLDVVVVAADWGSGRRQGWLSNYHLGVVDGAEFLVIGKTFKGLTDERFEWMTEKLQNLKVSEDEYTVKVVPKLVVEVAFNEIQKSPQYRSGFALRFARVKKIRVDKSPRDADTLETVRKLYEKQFRYKDKLEK